MKYYIKIIFILTVLCAQAPLDLIIDTTFFISVLLDRCLVFIQTALPTSYHPRLKL